ncbi:FG-GAP-like repeat-containing protein [Stieleria sp. JC731]|uniref:FG-GAP-like repeat-containing protein n=1 Tax=Pirellulaceae TaxID=2691357 RepID=UPI001E4A85F7|nr:FG-GAP-like repeat-containing protein [Stieleria sp. JC731]MCC9603856.1 FG-GAP-like repeat-containing protein [Stieleria sp. JC731]
MRSATFANLTIIALFILGSIACDRKQVNLLQNPDSAASSTHRSSSAIQGNGKTAKHGSIDDSQQLLSEAKQLINRGDFAGAETKLQQRLLDNADAADAKRMLAQVFARKGQFESAAELLLELSESVPSESVALQMQAAELLLSIDPMRSIQIASQLVQQHPDHDVARRLYAGLLNEQGFRFDANEQLRRLAGRTALSTRELIGLVNPLLTWVQFSTKPDISDDELLNQTGVLNVVAALRANGDVREARQALLESELLVKQRHPAALAMVGWLHALNQDFQALDRWAGQTTDEMKRYPAFWIAMGSLLQHQKQTGSAMCFYEALRREPGAMEAATALAQSYASQGKETAAQEVREYQKLVNESQALAYKLGSGGPPNPGLAKEMGRVMNSLGRPIEALAWQEAVIQAIAPGAKQLDVIRENKSLVLDRLQQQASLPLRLALTNGELLDAVEQMEKSLAGSIDDSKAGSSGDTETKTTTSSTSPPSAPHFVNVASSLGISIRHFNRPQPIEKEFRLFEALGSGIAALDFDLDGNVDLYCGQAGSDPPQGKSRLTNELYRNLQTTFAEITRKADCEDFSYTHGVTAGDWNQDGFPDLFLGNVGQNRLFVNQGDGSFREVNPANQAPSWDKNSVTTSVAIADLDGDAIADLCEVNYVDDEKVYREIEYDSTGAPVLLPGPKQFAPAMANAWLTSPKGKLIHQPFGNSPADASTGLGILVSDIDSDGTNEVFVANDQNPNHLWKRNVGESTWSDVAIVRGVAFGSGGKPMACMGIAVADFDNNQELDLHITNFNGECSNLYLQDTYNAFADQAIAAELDRVTVPMVGFGTQAFDYDQNGSVDLVIANGHIEDFRYKGKPFRMPTQLLAGVENKFVELPFEGNDPYFRDDHLGRCAIKLDHNRDGMMDIAISDLQEDLVLLQNRTQASGKSVMFELVGIQTERDAIGAQIEWVASGQKHRVWVQTGDGYMGKNESVLHVGLGNADSIDKLTVRWPSGQQQQLSNIVGQQRLLIIEGEQEAWSR